MSRKILIEVNKITSWNLTSPTKKNIFSTADGLNVEFDSLNNVLRLVPNPGIGVPIIHISDFTQLDNNYGTTTLEEFANYIINNNFFSPASGGSEAVIWKDNIMPFSAAKGNGTTEPVWSNIGNGLYKMKFTAGDELFVSFHVNHDYKIGTDAYPHVHWLSDLLQGSGDTTVWQISYVVGIGHKQGGSLTAALTTFTITHTADGTEIAGEHIISECLDADAFDLIEPDTLVLMGVKLISTTTAGNIFGIMADLHYQADRDGTLNKAPNFYV